MRRLNATRPYALPQVVLPSCLMEGYSSFWAAFHGSASPYFRFRSHQYSHQWVVGAKNWAGAGFWVSTELCVIVGIFILVMWDVTWLREGILTLYVRSQYNNKTIPLKYNEHYAIWACGALYSKWSHSITMRMVWTDSYEAFVSFRILYWTNTLLKLNKWKYCQ